MIPLAAHRYAVARTRIGKGLHALAMGALVVGLVGTFSRGSWLAVLAGSGIFVFSRDWRLAGRIWLVAVICVVVVDLGSGGALQDTVQRTFGDWVLEQRAALMFAGVLMFLEHPFVGVGPGGFAESLDRFGAQVSQLWDIQPTPHNAYVQMAAETGVIGLVAFVAFLGVTLWALLREVRRSGREAADRNSLDLRRALLWSLATVCFVGMVVWPFAHGPGQLVVLVIAMSYVLPREPGESPIREAGS
jgi:O-antigen ligase